MEPLLNKYFFNRKSGALWRVIEESKTHVTFSCLECPTGHFKPGASHIATKEEAHHPLSDGWMILDDTTTARVLYGKKET